MRVFFEIKKLKKISLFSPGTSVELRNSLLCFMQGWQDSGLTSQASNQTDTLPVKPQSRVV